MPFRPRLNRPLTAHKKYGKSAKRKPNTIKLAVNTDLGLKSFARTPRYLVTEALKSKRLTRCKKVLHHPKTHAGTVKIFSEKLFTIDAVVNRRNDRYLAKSIEDVERSSPDHGAGC